MEAVLLFWHTNMAAVTSCENTLWINIKNGATSECTGCFLIVEFYPTTIIEIDVWLTEENVLVEVWKNRIINDLSKAHHHLTTVELINLWKLKVCKQLRFAKDGLNSVYNPYSFWARKIMFF